VGLRCVKCGRNWKAWGDGVQLHNGMSGRRRAGEEVENNHECYPYGSSQSDLKVICGLL
jgi:hypothetical protein